MDFSKLGYTEKWLEYGFLNEDLLNSQLAEFGKGLNLETERYRYDSLIIWLRARKNINNNEIRNFIELSKQFENKLFGGSAVIELFTYSAITVAQFEMIKKVLPEFGEWTKRLITREVLKRRLKSEELTEELFNECFEYKKEFKDNKLIEIIIKQTDSVEFLSRFATNGSGKQIRTLATKKLNKIKK